MTLRPGQTVSHYAILDPLGTGAMGEVYRARDTKLGREVAIKVLPEHFAEDPERLQRFEREARSLASLNHSNVAQIYGVDQVGNLCFLVLELVPGETLEDRLERGPLPVDEAMDVACQIAAGLEAAHEAGVIHRDLKPANVRRTPDGKVKVLDFGLAKASGPDADSGSTRDSVLSTEAGRLLGTPTYMAPEQARGRPIDRRVDVWAFGCVLYECIAARRAFAGDTMADVLAAVVEREPDWTRLPAGVPPRVRELLVRCLHKDPLRRLRDIGEARVLLEDPRATAEAVAGTRRSAARSVAFAAVGIVALLLGLGLARAFLKPAPAPPRPVQRFDLSGLRFSAADSTVAISPDGRWLASPLSKGERPIVLRRLDSYEDRAIEDTEGGEWPFFSPDSRDIAVFVDGRGLLRVGIEEGAVVRTVTADAIPGQGAWGPGGEIVFSGGMREGSQWQGLMRVPATGGTPVVLTTPDTAAGERLHNRPWFLPDGETVVFTVELESGFRVEALSLDRGERRILVDPGSGGRYLPTGHLVWCDHEREELLAAPFDPVALRVTGPAVVAVSGLNLVRQGILAYDVSNDGTLIYGPSSAGDKDKVLTWFSRDGSRTDVQLHLKDFTQPRLAPDGRRLLLREFGSPTCTLWMLGVKRGVLTRVGVEGDCHGPLWSSDGSAIFYDVAGGPAPGVHRREMAGGGESRPLVAAEEHKLMPASVTPDGRTLALVSTEDGTTGPDILLLDLGGERRAFRQTRFAEDFPAFSPDGRSLAWVSDETGAPEVYLCGFPDPGEVVRVSTSGGTGPVWSRDGAELFFTSERKMFAVPVKTTPTLEVGLPEFLFESSAAAPLLADYDYDREEQRFVAVVSKQSVGFVPYIHVVVNWFEEVRALAPGGTDR